MDERYDIWFYWMFYDHFSARSLLAKLGRTREVWEADRDLIYEIIVFYASFVHIA